MQSSCFRCSRNLLATSIARLFQPALTWDNKRGREQFKSAFWDCLCKHRWSHLHFYQSSSEFQLFFTQRFVWKWIQNADEIRNKPESGFQKKPKAELKQSRTRKAPEQMKVCCFAGWIIKTLSGGIRTWMKLAGGGKPRKRQATMLCL